jgi:diguanylate cyclase (GGDEF)-like protein
VTSVHGDRGYDGVDVSEASGDPFRLAGALPGSFGDLGPLGRERVLEPGATLWREGDPGDHVVVLQEGHLEVSHQAPGGEDVILRHLYPGAIVGEMAALDGQVRSATVRARGAARVFLVPARRFRQFLKERPDLLERLFWLQLERVRSLTWRVSRTHHRAITDPLTGLYDYGFFRERLAMELERAQLSGDPLALVMFDIDHFKEYNDTHGHQEGNKVLVRVAEILRRTVRRGDVVARYGGEEFVTLLYGAGATDAWRLAESFRHAVSTHSFLPSSGRPPERVTVSGGVATFPEDAHDDISLIKSADARLYAAKEDGRNRTVGPGGIGQ